MVLQRINYENINCGMGDVKMASEPRGLKRKSYRPLKCFSWSVISYQAGKSNSNIWKEIGTLK